MAERAANLFVKKFEAHVSPLQDRAKPVTPQVKGSAVHLLDTHLITFKHDPRAANRNEQMLAGVRMLANDTVKKHGGSIGYDLEKHPSGSGWSLAFKTIVAKNIAKKPK